MAVAGKRNAAAAGPGSIEPADPAQSASLVSLEANRTARGPRRPCGGGWMRSESSGHVVPKTCKKWLCPECNVWLRLGARRYLEAGALATDDAHRLTFLTLTHDAAGQARPP